MVKINGQLLEVEGLTIAQYLESTSYKINHIAIERNGEIVPKGLYNQ
ncbi:MAG: MoaD/ThiS family protein, partial [Cellulosilyticum sp.]|nr:MoaD/ThiS family protein [Cellulosilyticum sp.]